MSKDRKEQLKEKLFKIREDAAELNEAISNQEERRRRTFANPQTAEEADGNFPTMEELVSNLIIEAKNGRKKGTKEEILSEGTLLDKLRLYYISRDLSGYFDTDENFSKEDFAKVKASIRSKEDIELVKTCSNEFNTIIEFGRRLSFQYKRFQASFGMLAVLLNKWDGYELTADNITYLFQFKFAEQLMNYIDVYKYPYNVTNKDGIDEFYSTDKVQAFLKEYNKTFNIDGVTMQLDKNKCSFVINVDENGSLYTQILKESKEALQELSDFKAYVKAAEEYITASTLQYTPISIKMSIENIKEERYTRYLVKNLSYFRSELNEKRNRGENISPEEEKKAVIPDYYECKPTPKIYRECKRGLKLLESGKAT